MPIQWHHSHADPIWPDGTFNLFLKHFGKSLRFSYFRENFLKQFVRICMVASFVLTLIHNTICRPGAIMLWKKGHRVLTAGTMKVSLPSIIFAGFLIRQLSPRHFFLSHCGFRPF
jgi:hypothetical protein